MITLVVLGGLVIVSGISLVRWRRWSIDRRREQAMADGLPEVADLLIVVLGAGGSLLDGLRRLAEHGPPTTRVAFQLVLDDVDQGQPVSLALRSLPRHLGPAYRPLATSLTSAVRDGAPTSLLLLRLGDEARAERRRQQERFARSLSVRLLFPLVMCSLPAVVVGAVVPLVLVALGRF